MAFSPFALLGMGQEGLDVDENGNPININRAPDTVGTESILVNGAQSRGPVEPADLVPRSLGNKDFIDEARQAQENAPEHKGMFGTKGTLRDVLGLLGDAFLVQNGDKSVYDVGREREKLSDAMAGFTQDPTGAAERAAYVNPEMGYKLRELQGKDEFRQAQLKSLDASRTSQANDRTFGNYKDTRDYIARMFASDAARKNPAKAMAAAENAARMAGVTLEQLGVTENMSDEDRAIYAAGDMKVNQTMQLPYTERRVSASERQAAASETRANRPPAARAAPNPTSASMAAPLINKLRNGGRLSPSEAETLDRLGYDVPGKKRGSSVPPPPPAGGGKRTFNVIRN